MDLKDIPASPRAPAIVDVVVEIPKGSRNKVEFDPQLGAFRLDRILHSPVHYPGDYGFITGTLSPDGDPLDILVLVTDPTFTGCILSARPIGVLIMTDEAGEDEKVLAVPEHDPRFDEVKELEHLQPHLLREVEYFFEVYKDLEGKETAVLGWEPLPRAHAIIREAIKAFQGSR